MENGRIPLELPLEYLNALGYTEIRDVGSILPNANITGMFSPVLTIPQQHRPHLIAIVCHTKNG